MKPKHVDRAGDLYDQMDSYLEHAAKELHEDISVDEGTQDFFNQKVDHQPMQVKRLFEVMRGYIGDVEGCELNEISMKEYLSD